MIKKVLLGMTLVFVFSMPFACGGEVTLFKGEVPTAGAFKIPIPPEGVTDAEWEKGEVSFYITADNQKPAWTVFGMPDVMFITDGVNKMPMTTPGDGHLGAIQPGHPLLLTFKLPPLAREKGIVFENTRGVYGFSVGPEGRYTLEVWKGRRAVIKHHVDQMNRCFTVDAGPVGDDAVLYHYTGPDGKACTSPQPLWRGRLKPGQGPFTVKVAVDLAGGGRIQGETLVTPRAETLKAPLPPEDIQVGICYYNQGTDGHTLREENFGAPQDQTKNVREFIDNALGNLFILWSEEPDFVKVKFGLLKDMADRGHSFITIYHGDPPDLLARYRETMRGRFLENNIGEFASYIYQGQREAEACKVSTAHTDLRVARDDFVNKYIGGARSYHGTYKYVFSTSGSALAHYELAGGIDFMCSELYAIGAMNVAYATAEMRGAARRWKPEFWGGWLAHEWQTTAIPYTVPQKYALLKAGLYLQYMMGTSVIALESGGDYTQAGKYTCTEPDSEWKGEPSGKNYNYFGHAPQEYRRTMKAFYDFTRANPRPQGSPETRLALLLGNCDAWLGLYNEGFAVWAQHETAKTDPRWKYGAPERTWQAAMRVFFPVPSDALAPWGNQWVGGTPHGQVDVVGVDEDLWRGELSRYRFAAFAGWNSMVPGLAAQLNNYVEDGGTLFISVPHFSTRFDREYQDYLPSDLLGAGDLSALIDVRVETREPAADAGLKTTGGAGNAGGSPAGLPGNATRLGAGATLAKARLGKGVGTLVATDDGRPVVVTQAKGKGRVHLLLTWEYPGTPAIAPLYEALLRHFAGHVKQDITITPIPGREEDTGYIAFVAYPGKAFFFNTDCVAERGVNATVDGRNETLVLRPAEMRILNRK